MIREARCPICGVWSKITVDCTGLGFWWEASADCPNCGATVLVETECDHRATETLPVQPLDEGAPR